MIANTFWAGFVVFVWLTVIVNLAVALAPRARGIAFPLPLRFALVTPACLIVSLVAAFGYRFLQMSGAPFWMWGASVFTLAVALLVGATRRFLVSATPPVLAGALALAVLVPWWVEHPIGLLLAIATGILGLLEIVGVVAARGNERVRSAPDDLKFDVPRDLFDVEHKFIPLKSGNRVHYVDEGSGPTLLFLHGNPAWSFQWRDLIDGLSGSFRCVALDYPGFGWSEAPPGYGFTPREQSCLVEEFVDHLELRDITLVMQDWGGPIGLGLAGRRPELIARIALGNTWAWPTSKSEVRGKFSMIVGGPVGEFAQMNFNGFARFGLGHGVVRKLPQEVTTLYLRPFLPLHRRGIAAFYPGQITAASDYMAEVEACLSRISNRPALLFWGLRDQGFPRADLERFEKIFPNHKTFELAEADHFFFEDAAQQIVEEICAFASEASANNTEAIPQ